MMAGKLVVRYYRAVSFRAGPVLLRGYRLEKSEERSGDLFDVLTDLAERYRKTPDAVVEVIRLNPKTGEEAEAAVYTTGQGALLFPRPARLQTVRLLDEAVVKAQAPTPLERLPTYRPSGDYYVYIGDVAVERPAAGIILETDKGVRVLLLHAGMKRDSNSG